MEYEQRDTESLLTCCVFCKGPYDEVIYVAPHEVGLCPACKVWCVEVGMAVRGVKRGQ